MPRPIAATIDRSALRANLARARAAAGDRFVWAVVKANAYGHGLERVLPAFETADGLALLDLDEARRARRQGWGKPILLLEGFFEPSDVRTCAELALDCVVHCEEQLVMLERAPGPLPPAFHLKLNTGMNRLGFIAATAADAYRRIKALPGPHMLTLMMHFANADRQRNAAGPVQAAEQIDEFERVVADWPERRSLANSAALLLLDVGGDSVRPGIALYGGATDAAHTASELDLRPTMTLASKVIGVQNIRPGAGVGYGSRFTAARATRVGVIACGYADGYPRHAPDGTPVVVDGVRVPLVGRVSMDMITVDLTDAPSAGVGAPAELWGAQVPIDAVANAAGTVGYELMCALAPRVPVTEAG